MRFINRLKNEYGLYLFLKKEKQHGLLFQLSEFRTVA